MTAQLAIKAFGRGYESLVFDEVFDARATCNHHELSQSAEDLDGSLSWAQLQEQREGWRALLPERAHDRFPWLLSQPPGVVLKLLAFLIAITVKGVYGAEPETQSNGALAQALGLDMREWWSVSGDSYLNHVSKGRIVEVVTEAVDASTANTLQTMKKADAMAKAEQVLTGKGWLPSVLRVGPPQEQPESKDSDKPGLQDQEVSEEALATSLHVAREGLRPCTAPLPGCSFVGVVANEPLIGSSTPVLSCSSPSMNTKWPEWVLPFIRDPRPRFCTGQSSK